MNDRLGAFAAAAFLAAACIGLASSLRPAPHYPAPPTDLPLLPFTVPPEQIRVAFLGTSLTALYDWPTRAAEQLSHCLDLPVKVIVVAQPGANAGWGQGQIDRVAAFSPDVVLIEFAINDADLKDGLGSTASTAAHRKIILGLRDRLPDVRIGLMTMSPAEGLRGWVRPNLAAYYARYHTLAVDLQTGLLDLYSRWMAQPESARGLEKDGLHPDTAVAGNMILPALVPWLSAAVGRSCPP